MDATAWILKNILNTQASIARYNARNLIPHKNLNTKKKREET